MSTTTKAQRLADTIRQFGGASACMAADELLRLEARVAELESERAANAILTAEIAGLQASAGHLGALVDMQRSILVDVERVLGSDSFDLPLEDGDSKIMDRVRSMLSATTEQKRQDCEPFGYFRPEPFGWTDCAPDDEGAIPLYAAPKKREPLSDAEITAIRRSMPFDDEDLPDPWDFAQGFRAAEKAHGIGGQS